MQTHPPSSFMNPTDAVPTYAVIGNPISHSLSPLIHQEFAKQFTHNLAYIKIECPLDGLKHVLDTFQQQGGRGVNITLPFKREAMNYVDELSPRAKRAQAVNTIAFQKDGHRYGDNTDGMGFITCLYQYFQLNLENKSILILGAGGATQGILPMILAKNPKTIILANRTKGKAEQVVNENAKRYTDTGCYCVPESSRGKAIQIPTPHLSTLPSLLPYSFDALNAYAEATTASTKPLFDVVINGTSMSYTQGEWALSGKLIHPESFCYDLAYNLHKLTPFLQWCQQQGATTLHDGLGMLVLQAAFAYQVWHGVLPDAEPIFAILSSMPHDFYTLRK